MKQRMFIALAAVSLLIGIVAGPALAAGGGLQRYQVATTSYTVAVLDTFMHTFVVTQNQCDDSIAITGSTPVDGGYYTTETVTGTLTNGVISFSATYDGPFSPGFAWSGSFPVGGGVLSGQFTGTVTAAPSTFSSYRNHGDYVSSMGGGAEAAHSCIGMPITSKDDTVPAAGTTAAGPDSGPNAAAIQARLAANDRLLARLAVVLARLHDSRATTAIQKHIDAIAGGGSGLGHAAQAVNGGGHPDHPNKAASPASTQDHPNRGNHSGKP